MDGDRHFKNKLVVSEDETLFERDSKKLALTVSSSLHHSIKAFLENLESNLSEEIDWNDTSVYTGTSGYVLLYLHLSRYLNDDLYLKKALLFTKKSLQLLKGHRISFICGDAGPLTLGAIVYDMLGKPQDSNLHISKLLKLQNKVLDLDSELPDELLYGRVGYLYSLLLLEQKVQSYSVDRDLIRNIVFAILESGKLLSRRKKLKVPLSYEWHGKNYYGAAHGVCGILLLLLQVKDYLSSSELNELIKPTIDDLMRRLFPSGNLASSEGSTSDRLVHWCHGAPAAVFLYALAFQIFDDSKYLDVASKAADVVWTRGLLKKGYGLCHGTAGNGYALLYMYQTTKQIKYLKMSVQFAHWCQDYGKHGCRTPDRPLSLFEGLAGTICFLIDIQNPDEAKFPGFIL